VGILRGRGKIANNTDVEVFLYSVQGLNLALNNIDYPVQSVDLLKPLLVDLLDKYAKELGVAVVEDSGKSAPKNLADLLIFYWLLIICCKLCIAKHDEAII
jgi:hypothetical protein